MGIEYLYSEDYYKDMQEGSWRSAKEIIPLVLELIHPKSVIDVGCAVGTWLLVFKEYGVKDIMGVDGPYVDKKMLQISEERFLSFDLRKPLRMNRQFDLVVSLEVAEHIPRECAETFIDNLVRLGPVILFSAAIPFQDTEYHLNEQWPDYWVKYFQERGYVMIDCIRKKIWQSDNVELWYAQNILMFVRQNYLKSHPLLRKLHENTATSQLSIVHPRLYLKLQQKYITKETQLQSIQTKLQSILNSRPYGLLSYLDWSLKKFLLIRNMLKHVLNFLFSLCMKFCKKTRRKTSGENRRKKRN